MIWFRLEINCEFSEINVLSSFARTSSQTNLESCSFAILDEWNALTVKHCRSSSEFGLAKEIEGWRSESNFGGYYMVFRSSIDPGQVPSIIPKLNTMRMTVSFGGYESPSYRILRSIYALATEFYAFFRMETYYTVKYYPHISG
ncbi:hypothetical protein V6N13_010089 [Hibiscus sabdariffa]